MSIRSKGVTSVAVDKDTRAKLKQLADGGPVYEYIADLVKKELENKQGVFPGQEPRSYAPATKADLSKLKTDLIEFFETRITAIGDARGLVWNIGHGQYERIQDKPIVFSQNTNTARSVAEGQLNFSEVESG